MGSSNIFEHFGRSACVFDGRGMLRCFSLKISIKKPYLEFKFLQLMLLKRKTSYCMNWKEQSWETGYPFSEF